MATPPDSFDDLDPRQFDGSPYRDGTPRERAQRPPPNYPTGLPQNPWEPAPTPPENPYGQGQPPPWVGQGQPPPWIGQGQPPPWIGQGQPPPWVGQGQPPPWVGQGQPPPWVGQGQPPPWIGQGQPPPWVGQGQPPPWVGQGQPPPWVGQGQPPPWIGQEPSPPWVGQGQSAGQPNAGQPWGAFPAYPPASYPSEGFMGEISQPPYFDQGSGVQPWTIPAEGPLLSSRSWPDVSLDRLDPYEPPQPPLARVLPRWLLISASIAAVALLVVMALTGNDWAAGAFHAGLAAGVMAAIIGSITVVRSFGGMAARTNDRRTVQYTGAVLVMVILFVFASSGIGLQGPIHRAQANVFLSNHQWQRAIDELRLAGETPPASEDLARIYDEWGESLSASQRYAEATATFAIVLKTYKAAPQGVRRAQSGSIATAIAWGRQSVLSKDYKGAVQHFDAALKQPFCLADCQTQVSRLDATAYYNLAESSLKTQDFADAASAFAALTTRFAAAPEAQQVHADYANALLGWGKQQIASSTCTDAVPTYQKLADGFADTAPGQQATTALLAPQPVLGQLTTADPTLKIQAILAANLQVNPGPDGHSPTIASFSSVATTPLTSNGSFKFAPIPQGHYPLLWQFSSGDKQQTITFINTDGSNTPAIVANVGPLCPYNFGAITQPLTP